MFSCLFETFCTVSEIMFSSDSVSKKNQQQKIHECLLSFTTSLFGMVGKQWFKNVRMTGISSFTIADSN